MMKKSKKSILKTFFQSQVAVGLILIFSSISALIISNSANYQIYQELLNLKFDLNIVFLSIYKPLTLQDWINDGLMAIFFFLVGLELKKEILIGELSSKAKMMMPLFCAIGGVLSPILFFGYFNYSIDENLKGFAIPCATDIAFAYGFIALFGKTFSQSLKVFLVALAVIDDLIAILIIAFFYTDNIQMFYLGYGVFACIGLLILNQKKSTNIFLYLCFGILLWLMILKSGIHATIAGVIFALFIPLRAKSQNFLEKTAHNIAPIVNFFILPIFAFANSGITIEKFNMEIISTPLILGIAFGLFLGKQIGVMLVAIFMVKFNIAKLPRGTSWLEFYGVSLFTGIGFTMSLFIGSLAFKSNNLLFDEAKIGILLGSIISMIGGSLVAIILQNKNKLKYKF
jgi:NhaA family Na+:H+ antiporter